MGSGQGQQKGRQDVLGVLEVGALGREGQLTAGAPLSFLALWNTHRHSHTRVHTGPHGQVRVEPNPTSQSVVSEKRLSIS